MNLTPPEERPPFIAVAVPESTPTGYTITVYTSGVMEPVCELKLPDWTDFRPASAGHRLIEHGFMISPRIQMKGGWRAITKEEYPTYATAVFTAAQIVGGDQEPATGTHVIPDRTEIPG